MKTFRSLMMTFFALCLTLNLVGTTSTIAYAKVDAKTELTSPEELINPDGTLKLDGSFNGSLDLEGWNAQIDPVKGVVFSSKDSLPSQNLASPAVGDWGQVGDGEPIFNSFIYDIFISGTDIYVGGQFTNAAGIPEADYIAKWNGVTWSALGNNGAGNGALDNLVAAITMDASNNLYIGGSFFNAGGIPEADHIAKWNGTTWSALGNNGAGNPALADSVKAIVVDGNNLYVGGFFQNAGGNPEADRLAKWNGSTWSAVGSNGSGNGIFNGNIFTLAIDGSDLYVGGNFTDLINIPEADYVVKWDGISWSALGSNGTGNGSINSLVTAIAINGNDLYVGGNFTDTAGIIQADFIAKWNGNAWSALGSNGPTNGPVNNSVKTIVINGTDIYVGGEFNNAAGIEEADRIAKWDGTTWSGFGDSDLIGSGGIYGIVYTLAISASGIYAGGDFTDAAKFSGEDYFAFWDGSKWKPEFAKSAFNAAVRTVTVIGSETYVGGQFTNAAGIPEADYIAKWDGTSWSALGGSAGVGAINNVIVSLTTDGSNLYAGGYFINAAGVPEADYIAKWNGTSWSALGSSAINNTVNVLAMDASNNLYAGGNFLDAAGIPEADRIAKWNGSVWSAVGNTNAIPNGIVYALVFIGNDLYIGGSFLDAAGIPEADRVVKWNGAIWSALGGSGGTGAITNVIYALETNGTDLYAGGVFINIANIAEADRVAKWNGTAWSALGGSSAINAGVIDLKMVGNDLYIAGDFSNAGGIAEADYVTRWDGSTWNALGHNGAANGSINATVSSIEALNTQLFVGGYFTDPSNNGKALPKADYFAAYGIADTTPPQVQSIVRTDSSPTSAATVNFIVTFTENVVNDLDALDFLVTTTGVIGASINSISTFGSAKAYTVNVNTGSGNGTIRLDIPNTATITDLAGIPLGGLPYTDGEAYDIEKTISSTSTFISTATQDGQILETTETSGKGGTIDATAVRINLGDDAANKQYRAILSFDTSALPDNAVITSVTLKVKYAGKVGTLPFSTHGNLLADIRKGPFSNNAALQTNDFKAAASKNSVLSFTNSMVSNWFSQSLAPANFQYINLTNVTQFRLRFQTDDNHDFGADILKIFSSNAGASGRPKLIIEYYAP